MLSLEAGFSHSPNERKPDLIHKPPSASTETTRHILVVVERTLLTLLSVTVSILVPDFSSMMAFLGSFSAFIICIIGPISAKVALTGRCGLFDAFVLFLGCVMAVWGTVAAFTAE
jgi:vesicular inhibitory amino acid transporter